MKNLFTGEVEYTHAINHLKHDYDSCVPFQWVRECLENSKESGATKVEFGIEWQAVEKKKVYRRTIADNGKGMSAEELPRNFSGIGDGSKKIGGAHDNYGVGIKISGYWWNPKGIVIISYQNHIGHMIEVYLDPKDGKFKLTKFTDASDQSAYVIKLGKTAIDSDGIDWAIMAPDWVRRVGHGTVIVFLGSEKYPNTARGDFLKGENNSVRGIQTMINTRYWDLLPMDVRLYQLPSDKATWPLSHKDYKEKKKTGLRLEHKAYGASHFANYKKWKGEAKGFLKDKGSLYLDEGKVFAEWYLWEGELPETHQAEFGYIAVRYKNELYDMKSGKHSHRLFGISDSGLKKRVVIILEPQLSDGKWGVLPNKSRSGLRFIDNHNSPKKDLPWDSWAHQFATRMPLAIQTEIAKNVEKSFDILEDNKELEKLGGKFSDRYRSQEKLFRQLVTTAGTGYRKSGQNVTQVLKFPPIPPPLSPNPNKGKFPSDKSPRPKRAALVLKDRARAVADPQGTFGAEEVDVTLNLPRYRWDMSGGAFEDTPHSAATWIRNDVGEAATPDVRPTILLNPNHIFFKSTMEEFKRQWPSPPLAPLIESMVRREFGQLAVLQVAHICKSFPDILEDDLDANYFSDQSLTHGLAGILSTESLIFPKLVAKLGKPYSGVEPPA